MIGNFIIIKKPTNTRQWRSLSLPEMNFLGQIQSTLQSQENKKLGFFLWQIKIRGACQCLAVTQRQRKFRVIAQIPVHTAELADQRWLLTAHPVHLQFLFLLLEPQVLPVFSFSLSWTQDISIAVNICAEWGDIKDVPYCALAVLVLAVCSISQVAPGCSGASQQWNKDKGSSQRTLTTKWLCG